MMYVDFEAGNKNYRLRLNTRNLITLEKQLGCNPLSIFGDGGRIPSITEMVGILYASMQQYNHGISLNDAYTIFDEYLEEHTLTEFLPVIIDIYKVSGLIQRDSKEEDSEKN